MAQKMLVDATHPEETRVVVVDGNKVEEFDFESINKKQLAGNIYLAKVTRVEPSLQAAFIDYGGNRHGFLAFAEIHPDYYQIPVADREALIAEQAAEAEAAEAAETAEEEGRQKNRRRRRGKVRRRGEDDPAKAGEAPASGDAEAEAGAGPEDGEDDETGTDAAPAMAESAAPDARVSAPATDEAEESEVEEVESVGAEDVADEIEQRRAPSRRYRIQEVIKVRQILLVQVVKEERGNKGAALTTYLSLPGRYCVLMPNTARGGGISRKITSVSDRKKLREIAGEMEVPKGAGLIIRTAGSERTKAEIKRDYDYLLRQWEEIKDMTFKSIAPALIYEEGSLIKRAIRDLYSKDIDEVLVEGEAGFNEARNYMKMLMPSHARNVKRYDDPVPLFSRYQAESYLASMFNPVVQLKSGGYIVIGVTEALVAIDINSGRSTREHSIEETALKTNLEAAEEIARQLRLRDLAGLIVIDFIDMEERRNNAAVEKRLKDKLKSDRARIQVGRISAFGLLEMSRQRLRPGILETITTPCPHCHGTGLIRSDESLALTILRELEDEGVRQRAKEVLAVAPVGVSNYLINQKRDALTRIELRYGLSVRIECDPSLVSPEYRIERFKTASRVIAVGTVTGPITVDTSAEFEEDEDLAVDEAEEVVEAKAVVTRAVEARPAEAATAEGEEKQGGRKRRRRRRRRGGDRPEHRGDEARVAGQVDTEAEADDAEDAGSEADVAETPAPAEVEPADPVHAEAPAGAAEAAEAMEPAAAAEATTKTRRRTRARKPKSGPSDALDVIGDDADPSAPLMLDETNPLGPIETAGLAEAPADPRADAPAEEQAEAPVEAKPRKARAPRKTAAKPAADAKADAKADKPARRSSRKPRAEPAPAGPEAEAPATAAPAPAAEPAAPEPVADMAADAAPAQPAATQAPAEPVADGAAAEADAKATGKPRRRGWWALGR